MRRILFLSLVLTIAVATSAAAQVNATIGAGGVFPPGTTFNGVPINALQAGVGVELEPDGSALGQLCVVLVGVNALGMQQNITVVGKASSARQVAPNIVTVFGSCSVDMGTGAPPTVGVPFTLTLTTDANDQGTIGLVVGATTLPNATILDGTATIK